MSNSGTTISPNLITIPSPLSSPRSSRGNIAIHYFENESGINVITTQKNLIDPNTLKSYINDGFIHIDDLNSPTPINQIEQEAEVTEGCLSTI